MGAGAAGAGAVSAALASAVSTFCAVSLFPRTWKNTLNASPIRPMTDVCPFDAVRRDAAAVWCGAGPAEVAGVNYFFPGRRCQYEM
jgi:hypothetical protein